MLPALCVLSLLSLLAAPPAAAKPDDPWAGWRFLVGEWSGDGSGQPGQGQGGASFVLDLGEKVLVRRSQSVYPAAQGKTVTHEDLLVVYPGSGTEKEKKAVYFDNEGHGIHYSASATADGVVFLSEPAPDSPRFRLTYLREKDGGVRVRFEIARPDKPDAFSPYVEGVTHKKAAKSGK